MEEINRSMKVISMLMTGHSVLRDRYRFISSFLEIVLLIGSIILNVVVFIDDKYIFKMSGVTADTQKLIAGITSIVVFTISILLLQVRWKEKAEDHSKANQQLFKLLQECRSICLLEDTDLRAEAIGVFAQKYTAVFDSIVAIPENKFNALKMIHYRKIELSKLIERYPKSRLFILKIRLFMTSFKETEK